MRIHRYTDPPSDECLTVLEECSNASDRLFDALSESNTDRFTSNKMRLKWEKSDHQTLFTARQTGVLSPYKLISGVVASGVVVAGCIATLINAPVRAQAFLYLLGVGMVVVSDPLRAFTKILAPQSRILICMSFLLSAIACIKSSNRFIMIVTTMAALSFLLIKFLNGKWLHSYNWLVSESVRKAVAKNPESKGYQIWEEYGKREARVTLSENGLRFDDGVLDSYGMVLFLHGFYTAIQKNTKLKKRAQKVQENMDDMIYQVEDMTDAEQRYQARIDELETELSNLKFVESKLKEVQKERDYLMSELESLEQVEDLLDPEEDPEDIDQKIIEMLRSGESIRNTAKACNVTDYHVNKLRNQIKGELTA